MSRYHPKWSLEQLFSAMESLKQKCFIEDGSVFSDHSLWSVPLVEEIRNAFWTNEDAVKAKYLDKLETQMKSASPEGRMLMAELNWFLQVFITNTKPATKREQIIRIWSWSGTDLPHDHPMLSNDVLVGVGNPGAAFNTMRWRELAYLFDIVAYFKKLTPQERIHTLSDPWIFSEWLDTVPRQGYRQFRHMIRYLFFPDSFERIVVSKHKRKFIHTFLGDDEESLKTLNDIALDKRLYEARDKLESEFKDRDIDFYREEARLKQQQESAAENIPSNISREHILQALSRIDSEGVPPGAQSSTYDLVHEEKPYPPKLVMSWANLYANGSELDRSSFSGGLSTPCFKLIEDRGFKIQRKGDPIRSNIHKILSEYSEAKSQPLKDHPLATLIRKDFPILLKETIFPEDQNIIVSGTKFVGSWAHVPWLAILDTRISRSTQSGVYIGLLFSEKGDQVFLNIGQGVTSQTMSDNDDNRTAILEQLEVPEGYSTGPLEGARIGESSKAKSYGASVVFYKAFPKDDLPSENGWEKEFIELRQFLDSLVSNAKLMSLYSGTETDEEEGVEDDVDIDPYSLEEAMDGLFIEDTEVMRILGLLRSKKNIILQGPPGVGKTFVAKRLAYSLMGQMDSDRVEMVQFHQSYSYEDFIQGFRPSKEGFNLQNGRFFEFCQKARSEPDKEFVFIIDEINRGNLSKIFGELMMLIEHDKRGPDWAVPLTYSATDSEPFYVPKNLYIVGMMNTADRSLAMVDYALRRRFAFINILPAINSQKFKNFLLEKGVSTNLVEKLVQRIAKLNSRIELDKANLGPGFSIGHSYFCNPPLDHSLELSWFEEIVKSEIEPLIREYWFDDPDTADTLVAGLLD